MFLRPRAYPSHPPPCPRFHRQINGVVNWEKAFPGDVSWNFAAKFLVDKEGNVVERNGSGAGESKAKLQAML